MVVPLRVTVDLISLPARSRSSKVALETPMTGSLKAAVTLALRLTRVAPAAGLPAVTVGAGPEVKVQEVVASGFPARSRMAVAPPVRVTV